MALVINGAMPCNGGEGPGRVRELVFASLWVSPLSLISQSLRSVSLSLSRSVSFAICHKRHQCSLLKHSSSDVAASATAASATAGSVGAAV